MDLLGRKRYISWERVLVKCLGDNSLVVGRTLYKLICAAAIWKGLGKSEIDGQKE